MAKKYEFDEIVGELLERGRGVKDLLRDMKDISELMVDLAYSAVLFNNDELANEVRDLEEEMNKLRYQVEIRTMLAAKNPAQAAKLAGILKLASEAENISNAADRLAGIVLRDVEIHPALRDAILESREHVDSIEVRKGAKISGKAIKDIKKDHKGVKFLAIRKNGSWITHVSDSDKINVGDHLIVSGLRDSVEVLKSAAK
ncbi:TPA: potassium channel protein [archaeon]|uniref:Potassium channel protein n=1 Tax=Candidatus Naiadarchaeum limnaeum TaxID=2756139 RepID=A0A832XJA9_9ARCH|nr:potassium channel protein [Candidatus Naiadarchaeales archaeon SRR2090153.bin1042]HIK00322.1 potassium channel protein [Candidatus Naiadarchaeum limnaeum]